MTTAQLADEAWWGRPRSAFPWRWSGARDYPVLFVDYGTRELVARMVRIKNWRGIALRPGEVTDVIKRLKHIARLTARGKTVVDCLTEQLWYFRNVGVCLVQDGPERR